MHYRSALCVTAEKIILQIRTPLRVHVSVRTCRIRRRTYAVRTTPDTPPGLSLEVGKSRSIKRYSTRAHILYIHFFFCVCGHACWTSVLLEIPRFFLKKISIQQYFLPQGPTRLTIITGRPRRFTEAKRGKQQTR